MPKKSAKAKKKAKTTAQSVPEGALCLLGARLRGICTRFSTTFAAGGAVMDAAALRATVPGFGVVPVPCEDTDELVTFCRTAPFGRGVETVEDPAVRATLEAPFTLEAGDGVAELLRDVALQFAVPADELELQPHKLLVYEEGGHFDWHVDTEKDAGHIATLVVQLGSAYTGGALRVRHRNSEMSFPFAGEAPGVWAAFFTDCDHKVEPVRSGRRVVLTFNVLRRAAAEPAPAPTAAIEAHTAALVPLLQRAAQLRQPVAFVLEHAYTPLHLSEAWLKSGDGAAFQAARLAAEQAGCEQLAATLGILQVAPRARYVRGAGGDEEETAPDMFDDVTPAGAMLVAQNCEEPHEFSAHWLAKPWGGGSRIIVTHSVSLTSPDRVVDRRRNDWVDAPWPALSDPTDHWDLARYPGQSFPGLPAMHGEGIAPADFLQGNVMMPSPALTVRPLNGSFAPNVAVTDAFQGNNGAQAELHYFASAIVFAQPERLGDPVHDS